MGSEGAKQVRKFDDVHNHVRELVSRRMRAVFGGELWPQDSNALQLTSMAANEILVNHFDDRVKWEGGIATLAWDYDPNEHRLGKALNWNLHMDRTIHDSEKHAAGRVERQTFSVGPRTAYVIRGKAQGHMAACQSCKQLGRHGVCSCCWTHGVEPVTHHGTSLTAGRQSPTIRRFNPEWGRA